MTIYFLSAEGVGLVKIGHSKNPSLRISGIRGESPIELRLLGTMPGDRHTERALHVFFKRFWKRGEWFHHAPEIEEVARTGRCPGLRVDSSPRKIIMIRLSDEERQALERHRRAMGERSFAGVVRSWIEREPEKQETVSAK